MQRKALISTRDILLKHPKRVKFKKPGEKKKRSILNSPSPGGLSRTATYPHWKFPLHRPPPESVIKRKRRPGPGLDHCALSP